MTGKALLFLAVLLSAGCRTITETRLVCPDIPDTSRPSLPALSASDLACMSDDAYERLLERDRKRRNYSEDQDAILRGLRDECARIERETHE